jgi:glycosyltransferase involved in cell wall biosynthesis
MSAPPEITLFVACYNEAPNIVATLDTIRAALRRVGCTGEVIVIDDDSTDDSVRIVRAYQRANPELPIRLHINASNRGLARNFFAAAALGRGRYFKLVCGDNVESEETLVKILHQRECADLVLPYHLHCIGRTQLRAGLSRLYTRLVNLMSGHSIRYYNGLPLCLREDVLRWRSRTTGFGFQADMVTQMLDAGVRHVEVEVEARDRTQGVSQALTWRNLVTVAATLLTIGARRLRPGKTLTPAARIPSAPFAESRCAPSPTAPSPQRLPPG